MGTVRRDAGPGAEGGAGGQGDCYLGGQTGKGIPVILLREEGGGAASHALRQVRKEGESLGDRHTYSQARLDRQVPEDPGKSHRIHKLSERHTTRGVSRELQGSHRRPGPICAYLAV